MHYQISRNGQMYGPYTMDDLRRYVASGHILPTDLAKSEEMPEWVPVSQLLGPSEAMPASQGAYVPPSMPYAQRPLNPGSAFASPDPPNLHWALVLLLDLLTCSLFQMVWNIVLGAWFKRVVPSSKTLVLYIASAILLLVQGVMGQALGLMSSRHHGYGYSYSYNPHLGGYGMYALVATACWVVRLIARFTFRGELDRQFNGVEQLGLSLNPVMTFFFGGIYLQSQMNRVNDIRRTVV